jgi:ribonuclease HI
MIRMAIAGVCSESFYFHGGWGMVLENDSPQGVDHQSLQGWGLSTTLYTMELTAVLQGFRTIAQPSTVELLTNNPYVVTLFQADPRHHRIVRPASFCDGLPHFHPDLWPTILDAMAPHTVTCIWAPRPHPLITEADTLAHRMLDALKTKVVV